MDRREHFKRQQQQQQSMIPLSHVHAEKNSICIHIITLNAEHIKLFQVHPFASMSDVRITVICDVTHRLSSSSVSLLQLRRSKLSLTSLIEQEPLVHLLPFDDLNSID